MHRGFILGLIWFFAASAANACELKDEKGSVPNGVNCPNDIRVFIDRTFKCQHFAAEINGDNSLRDRQVNEQLMKLKCEELKADYAHMNKKYASDVQVITVIQKIIDDYTIDLY